MNTSRIRASLAVTVTVLGLFFLSAIELNAQSKQSSSPQSSNKSASKMPASKKSASKKSASKKSASKKSASKKSASKKSASKKSASKKSASKKSASKKPSGGSSSGGSSSAPTPEMVTVQGGTLPTGSELAGQTVSTFEIGKYEVTWGEWQMVCDWAEANGYDDLHTYASSKGNGSHPIQGVSILTAAKWCNAKSEKEGLIPVYELAGEAYKSGEAVPTVSESANGYRLPTTSEWEWAARGGISSLGYTYSGSNKLDDVGWYKENSNGSAMNINQSRGTWPVGEKVANELGIYDMSGNVWEYVFNQQEMNSTDLVFSKLLRGGSWYFDAEYCTVSASFTGWGGYFDIGFRLARNTYNDAMITVEGGILPSSSELAGQTVSTFEIGKYEVTWKEWQDVRDWAVENGYSDLVNVGQGIGDDYPVVWVNMFDALKWCNAKSELEGLKPVYKINGDVYRFGEPVYGSPVYNNGVPDYLEGVNEPTLDISANGYRLPNAKEFVWAARGGVEGKNLTYPGSDQIELVAWYKDNSDGYSHKVGTKIPNNLGIFDLSGNAVEWTMDRTNLAGVISKNPHVRQFGGDYSSSQKSSTVESFMWTPPIITWGGAGFRLARNSAQ